MHWMGGGVGHKTTMILKLSSLNVTLENIHQPSESHFPQWGEKMRTLAVTYSKTTLLGSDAH